MDIERSKKTIARYLVGNSVSRDDLASACKSASKDAGYLAHLGETLGLHRRWVSDCDRVRGQLAELTEMTADERQDEVPELDQHLRECLSCRHLYWTVAPVWEAAARSGPAAGGHTNAKALAQSLRLFARAGMLRDTGTGPPPKMAAGAEGTLLLLDDDVEETAAPEQTWTLVDDDAQCRIRIVLTGSKSGSPTLSVELDCDTDSAVDLRQARFEIRSMDTDTPLRAGPLTDLEQFPVQLPFGRWSVRLRAQGPAGPYTWDIPLTLEGD